MPSTTWVIIPAAISVSPIIPRFNARKGDHEAEHRADQSEHD